MPSVGGFRHTLKTKWDPRGWCQQSTDTYCVPSEHWLLPVTDFLSSKLRKLYSRSLALTFGFMWPFQRSLNSVILKVCPCGPLRTKRSGEFLRKSDSRAVAYRVGGPESLHFNKLHRETLYLSQIWGHSFHESVLIWLMQKHNLSPDSRTSCELMTGNTKIVHGHIDGQWLNCG